MKKYFIYATDKNNIAYKEVKKMDIKNVFNRVATLKKDGFKSISVFDFDTWNTSESKGLVMFSDCCDYWMNNNILK